MVKDKLKIILITYNRVTTLKSTFEQIFAVDSPIKNFDITILNNASTDGTDELISEYQKQFPNLKHIRNSINIGGNANICRAFEMSAISGKEYGWILCDDDVYNLSNWKQVEECIERKDDIICVSNYVFPTKKFFDNKAYQIFQLTFVPACIFRTENITDKVLFNMYESTYSMFQQLALTIDVINNEKKICVLEKPIVFNGLHFENKRANRSYTRGTSSSTITERRKQNCWVLGFANIITLLNDKKLIRNCLEASIPYTDIYGSWRNFYINLRNKYLNSKNFSFFYEIYKYLPFRRKFEFWICNLSSVTINSLIYLPARLNSLKIGLIIMKHNLKSGKI